MVATSTVQLLLMDPVALRTALGKEQLEGLVKQYAEFLERMEGHETEESAHGGGG